MSENTYHIGYPDTPYYTDKKVKEEIDTALEKCAILHTKVGTGQLLDENGKKIDDRGSKEAETYVKMKENMILGEVLDLDPFFVEPLLYSEDAFDYE